MALFTPPPIKGCPVFSSASSSTHRRPAISFKWGWRRDPDGGIVATRTRRQAFQISANPSVSPGKEGPNYVVMVDPLEAKRLAAKQMEQIKAREKLKRRHQIEAINGGWAMIGLTAGLVIEGQTGKSILTQLADYIGTIFHLFVR